MGVMKEFFASQAELIEIIKGTDPRLTRWSVRPHPTKPGFTAQRSAFDVNGNPIWELPEDVPNYGTTWIAESEVAHLNAQESLKLIFKVLESLPPAGRPFFDDSQLEVTPRNAPSPEAQVIVKFLKEMGYIGLHDDLSVYPPRQSRAVYLHQTLQNTFCLYDNLLKNKPLGEGFPEKSVENAPNFRGSWSDHPAGAQSGRVVAEAVKFIREKLIMLESAEEIIATWVDDYLRKHYPAEVVEMTTNIHDLDLTKFNLCGKEISVSINFIVYPAKVYEVEFLKDSTIVRIEIEGRRARFVIGDDTKAWITLPLEQHEQNAI